MSPLPNLPRALLVRRMRAAAPELYTALVDVTAMLENSDCATGYCMCGSPTEGHSIGDGHAATDMGEFYQGQTLDVARAALALVEGPDHGK